MHTDQWDELRAKINPFIYGPLNFDKGRQHFIGRQLVIHVQRNETGPLPHTT